MSWKRFALDVVVDAIDSSASMKKTERNLTVQQKKTRLLERRVDVNGEVEKRSTIATD